ncbi:Acetyl esterase/lipase [Andreprevotia lacus DSM 23236]|jgi:acetyl esterase/lipase|uniref:Acetyl esterase/lipase n=1 Tax=Andreprevotia lacus DSM 23236 TaxID=1121001 RepID=A0A1W1X596_9NEIS|nr:alpha/beta hydrolase [Andreprevotia lacus]SMC19082.1 Acetyl esterase/lipase [Andreprevotia lacus DSM 23236]
MHKPKSPALARKPAAMAVSSLLLGLLLMQAAHAGTVLDRLRERRVAAQQNELESDDGADSASLPAGVRVLRDVAYGSDARQRMDVYLPQQAANAPVIFMVHGGAWRLGDKGAAQVVDNKVAHWVPKGFVFVSINYRMLPAADPLVQAQDVAAALAFAQGKAASWDADPARFVLMGHSAGAHLVSLLNSAPAKALQAGARPWLGTVSLDSAAIDVPTLMQHRHLHLYDAAFGSDQAFWQSASPLQQLAKGAQPWLGVCSSRRAESCPSAREYAAKAKLLGISASVLPQDKSHKEINQDLGGSGDYTQQVDAFLGQLDPALRRLLNRS